MKDKRQKMTLSWPCGDPVLAAYVLQAAAASGQLPYPGLFAAAAAASSPFGILPPRPPPPHPAPPHPFTASPGLPCRPTPTLIPPPPPHPTLLLNNDRKSPIEEATTSEDEAKSCQKTPNPTELTITVSEKTRTTSTTASGGGSLFQPYLDIEKK